MPELRHELSHSTLGQVTRQFYLSPSFATAPRDRSVAVVSSDRAIIIMDVPYIMGNIVPAWEAWYCSPFEQSYRHPDESCKCLTIEMPPVRSRPTNAEMDKLEITIFRVRFLEFSWQLNMATFSIVTFHVAIL